MTAGVMPAARPSRNVEKEEAGVGPDAGHTHRGKRTFHDEVEELWPRVALTLDGARVLAVVAYIHFLYLKAVLVLVPDAGHNGHARVHGPFVVPCEYDARAVQPGAFRDPIQQVAPVAAGQKDGGVRREERLLTERVLLNILTPSPTYSFRFPTTKKAPSNS